MRIRGKYQWWIQTLSYGGRGVLFFTSPADFSSLCNVFGVFFFTQNRRGGGDRWAPPLDPPLNVHVIACERSRKGCQ